MQVPKEIKDLEHFIEGKGKEMVRLYELAKKHSEAIELKEKLAKAMVARN